MIKSIDDLTCISCGLCENVCPMDIFRRHDNKIYIAYPEDCCNCMQCLFVCPVDAVVFVPGVPKKFDARVRWQQIKEALGMK